ncbi:phage portal protein [Desulfovibrio mangrovi]|uniref:phage portal protein n=1 Tax=Desulfovibrio mangrovi TaxID=2976983 RepID=UPI002246A875|nr:phage portal protein [Desulfovibrio mangrovi]UZP67668.1 phage portal protein [Desulfovibrio mangrovi]
MASILRTQRGVNRRHPHVRRMAGSHSGRLGGWHTHRTPASSSRYERDTIQLRAEDLAANDWAPRSVIDSMTVNVVGTGLKPQAKPLAERLGISAEEAREVARQQEFAWQMWQMEAHPSGKLSFDDLCFLGLRCVLIHGELLYLPVMLPDEGRKFSLAIQDTHPGRLRTPLDRESDHRIREGIEFNEWGAPSRYWIADPPAGLLQDWTHGTDHLSSAHFVCKPAFVAHRPCVLHLFRVEEVEQVRGISPLAAGMKLFRHLDDSLDYELMAQIITASIPVFIETEDAQGIIRQNAQSRDDIYHQQIRPGQIMYGNPGERPHILEPSRPGNNFVPFTELVLRAAAASMGMPYEVLAKDFSKSNYSSTRAALLEAWRVFMLYRTWMVNHLCRIIWAMVQEEAVLRGYVRLPKHAPGFYEAYHAWTNSKWLGPARGYVDPVKEVLGVAKALENRLTTHADAIAERGEDWEDVWAQRELEDSLLLKTAAQSPQGANANA